MSAHQDLVQGGGAVTAFGWCVSAWTWVTGGASPLAVLATVLTIALTALKLYDAIQRKRKGRPLDSSAMPLGDK
ncbi:MAG TPA: hypothetical protein VIN03_09495 [Roseateles sp.]